MQDNTSIFFYIYIYCERRQLDKIPWFFLRKTLAYVIKEFKKPDEKIIYSNS